MTSPEDVQRVHRIHMSTLTQLKYLVAYFVRHHCEPQDFDECGGEAAFIDEAAARIQDEMPTADLEDLRRFLIDGNVNEWIPLGQALEEVLIPAYPEEYEDHGPTRIQEEHDYKFGDWRL